VLQLTSRTAAQSTPLDVTLQHDGVGGNRKAKLFTRRNRAQVVNGPSHSMWTPLLLRVAQVQLPETASHPALTHAHTRHAKYGQKD
jgi:hypothetical protein